MNKDWLEENFHGKPDMALSPSHSHIERVYNYILNQEDHHKKKTFKQEYTDLLKSFEIDYNDQYLFEWYD